MSPVSFAASLKVLKLSWRSLSSRIVVLKVGWTLEWPGSLKKNSRCPDCPLSGNCEPTIRLVHKGENLYSINPFQLIPLTVCGLLAWGPWSHMCVHENDKIEQHIMWIFSTLSAVLSCSSLFLASLKTLEPACISSPSELPRWQKLI